ncbi:MAG TPA: tetratricopeptide repeat protein [Anaerolineae bacterium]|nr:tetratricopeptide repeat protein [Anaerolineae bacterium]
MADFQPVHPVTREAQTPVHAVPTNLPVQPTPFIGRERELAEIVGLLENPACRLLTLIGPGGIGKTRLAIQAAERLTNAFPHGVYFVPLAPLSSAEFLVSAVVNELGLAFYGSQDPKVQLLNYLHDKEMLLVMDNFEHLLAEDSRQANGAGFLAESLASAPGLRFIVTSRERLNLQGEWLFEIGAMDFPESETAEGIEDYSAVQLFLQTAHRVQPDFILSQAEQSSVVRICRAVGGMPLALELAAAWVRALPCAEIAARIEGNLSFLATSLRDVPERHRNMRAALDHSWKLLSEEERRAFRRLSVFQGGFELEAAEQVAEVSLPLLVALVDKSLVRRHASGRYDLHELLRQYASDKLSAAEETDAARRRHRDRYLNLALAAEPLLWGAGDAAWLRRLEAEQCNLRAALEWSLEHGDAEERLSLPAALGWFWYVTARFVEGRRWLERALATSQGASAQVRAKVLHRAANLAMMQQDFGRAVPLIEETLAAYRALETPGDPLGISWMIYQQGHVALFQGDFERAAALFAKSLAQFQAQADTAGIASLLMYLGIAVSRCGDYGRAVALLEESVPLLRELGDGVGVARALHGLGTVAYHQGHFAEATALLKDSLTVSRERGARLEIAQCLEGLASTARAQGQPERAARLFGAAEALRGAIGAPLPPADRAGHERDAAAVRAQLGKAAFDAASAEGRAMTMEQAIAYATGDGQE